MKTRNTVDHYADEDLGAGMGWFWILLIGWLVIGLLLGMYGPELGFWAQCDDVRPRGC